MGIGSHKANSELGTDMSGQSGGRGYLIQALITVLEAVTDDTAWTTMELEPTLASEKIDVVWHYPGRTKVVQIKSSQNQITAPDVRAWANELKASITANDYELRLIGPVSGGVTDMRSHGSVLIPTPQPLHLDGLLHQAAHKLDGYLRMRHFSSLSPTARELVAQALVAKLSGYATRGTPVDRAAFDAVLRAWILEIQQQGGNGIVAAGMASDLAKEKSTLFLTFGDLLGMLEKEVELVRDWTSRIRLNDEMAELSSHFPAEGVICRLRTALDELEQRRVRRGWLMAWKVNALLYAVHFKLHFRRKP